MEVKRKYVEIEKADGADRWLKDGATPDPKLQLNGSSRDVMNAETNQFLSQVKVACKCKLGTLLIPAYYGYQDLTKKN
jgi:hypothetical protein